MPAKHILGAWKRPISRTYGYNFEIGENYYSPMTHYLEDKHSGVLTDIPGALTFSERLAHNLSRQSKSMYSTSSSSLVRYSRCTGC